MNRRLPPLIFLAAAALSACAGGPRPEFEDRFDAAPAAGWTWLRENPGAWRVQDGALEIRIDTGNAETVRNVLVRPAPDRRAGKWAIEVTLTSLAEPTKQYEQGGITWYQGGKPGFKLVKELVNGTVMIVPGHVPMAAKTVQFRLVLEGEAYTALFRPGAAGEWLTAGSGKLPPPGVDDQMSLQCYNGPPDAEHWIRFDDFRVWRLAE